MNGFIEALDPLSAQLATSEHENVLPFIEFLREDPGWLAKAGLTKEEVESDQRVPFAGRDSETLVVSGVSGRVFSCGKDAPPPPSLKAGSGLSAVWCRRVVG